MWKFFFSVNYTEAIKRIHPCSFQIGQVNNKSNIDFISQKHCDRCCAKISLHSFSPSSRFSPRLVSSSFKMCSSMWKMPGGWDFPVIPKQWTLQKTWYKMKKTIASADFSSQKPLESLIQENSSSVYICNIANCLIIHHCIFNRLVTLLEKN